jgi:hypothetical protein
MTTTADELREQVRRRYAEAAVAADSGGCGCTDSGGCCGNVSCDGGDDAFGESLYDLEQRRSSRRVASAGPAARTAST